MIALFITLIVVGFVLFLITRFVPMEPRIKSLIVYLAIGLAVAVVVMFVLDVTGVWRNHFLRDLP